MTQLIIGIAICAATTWAYCMWTATDGDTE